MSADKMRMIDADGHVLERLELPEEVRQEFFSRISGGQPISSEDPAPTESSHAELMQRPGASEPGPRLVDMDADGIDIAVLYPTTPGLAWVPGAETFQIMAQEYNRWLHEYCSHDPSRLIGVGLVALQDPSLAIKEMERCVEQLDFKAVMIRPAPYIENKKLNDPVYDPFWEAAAELGCPIGVHPFSFPDMPWNVVTRLGLHDDAFGHGDKGLALRQGLGNALDVMVAMGWFVAGGICERFPNLTVVFLEGSGGWCAPMLERFDHHIEVFGSRYQTGASIGDLQAAVLHQLRPRRGIAGLHRQQQVRGRRPDRLGLRLPAPGRQDPGHRRRVARSHRDPNRRPTSSDLR